MLCQFCLLSLYHHCRVSICSTIVHLFHHCAIIMPPMSICTIIVHWHYSSELFHYYHFVVWCLVIKVYTFISHINKRPCYNVFIFRYDCVIDSPTLPCYKGHNCPLKFLEFGLKSTLDNCLNNGCFESFHVCARVSLVHCDFAHCGKLRFHIS